MRASHILSVGLSVLFLTVWLAFRFRYPWNPFGSTKAGILWIFIAMIVGLAIGLTVRAVRKR